MSRIVPLFAPGWGFPYPAAPELRASSPASPYVRACRPVRNSLGRWQNTDFPPPSRAGLRSSGFWLVAVALSLDLGATGLSVCDRAGGFGLSVALGMSRSAASAVTEGKAVFVLWHGRQYDDHCISGHRRSRYQSVKGIDERPFLPSGARPRDRQRHRPVDRRTIDCAHVGTASARTMDGSGAHVSIRMPVGVQVDCAAAEASLSRSVHLALSPWALGNGRRRGPDTVARRPGSTG